MPEEELKRYMKFLEDGSQAGLTQAELMGIRNVDEYLALGKRTSGGGGKTVDISNPVLDNIRTGSA